MKKKVILSILAIMLTSAILVGSFAWFYINESTYVDFGDDIICEAGESLEISDDGGNSWSGTINKAGFHAEAIDITGDGESFFKPIEIDETAQPTGFVEAYPMDSEGNGEYIDIQLMFRSTSKLNVYLSEDSYILPSDAERKGNIFGDFSRDFIAGATRAAFIHNGEVKMIWAPNPEYELTRNDNGTYNFNENGNEESTYYYTRLEGTDYIKTPFGAEDYATSRFVAGSTGANGTTEGNSAKLFTLTPAENDFGRETLTVRVWFEGTDREASEALAGGKVKVKLKFTGIEKSDNNAGQAEINALAYSDESITGIKDGMSYSFDGLTWEVYSSAQGMPDLSSYSEVYFRYDETNSSFRTDVKKITIS